MTAIPLTIKWGKETIEIPSFVPAAGVKSLKKELEDKTGVPIDRMKLMAKSKGLWKGVLKDDFDLTSLDWGSVKPPLTVLLMGSGATIAGPTTKTVFIEDLAPDEIAKVVEPSGLVNLGNTCYLNSVVQCLRAIPSLRSGLLSYHSSNTVSANAMLMSSLTDTLQRLDRQATAVEPAALVQATKMVFPQFAQRGPHGHPMQQDAEEFFSGVLTAAARELSSETAMRAALGSTDDLLGADNLIDAVFGMKMKETLTCDELAAVEIDDDMATDTSSALVEQAVVSYDLHRKLVCNIQGGSDAAAQANVSHIAEGIQLALSGKIEKQSDVLGRNAVWTRTQRIARLPKVLTVQFGRFYWKATPDSQDHTGGENECSCS
jgi:ubiquitin carboxyl-terminal hydrolase 14